MSEKDKRSYKEVRQSIVDIANNMFGDKDNTVRFLHAPCRYFNSQSLAQVARSKEGALKVETYLRQLEAGVYI